MENNNLEIKVKADTTEAVESIEEVTEAVANLNKALAELRRFEMFQ